MLAEDPVWARLPDDTVVPSGFWWKRSLLGCTVRPSSVIPIALVCHRGQWGQGSAMWGWGVGGAEHREYLFGWV